MRDDFENSGPILLQPDSLKNSYGFDFSPASSTTTEGAIPYGTTISTVSVSGYAIDGTVENNLINGSPSESGNVVTVSLDYPDSGAGKYKLRFLLTLDDGSVYEKDFNRITAVDL